jgi:hypothetical protein
VNKRRRVEKQRSGSSLLRPQSIRRPPRTAWLRKAEAAKADADADVTEKSAERGCRENCRQLLQAKVDAAAAEVEKARAELKQRREASESKFESSVPFRRLLS